MTGRSSSHPSQRRYPPELKQRAVRMVHEAIQRSGESHGVITRVARQLGVGSESLRSRVRQAEIDAGQRPGTTSQEAQRIAELEREVRELRRANEILKAASAFSPVNSTRARPDERLHRRSPRGVRGRADLPGAAARAIDLLRSPLSAALGPRHPRRAAQSGDHPRVRGRLPVSMVRQLQRALTKAINRRVASSNGKVHKSMRIHDLRPTTAAAITKKMPGTVKANPPKTSSLSTQFSRAGSQ